jgi:hypothetical protein
LSLNGSIVSRTWRCLPTTFSAEHFMCAVYTRNWTLSDQVSRKQINDLWEAVHEIPDLLTRWRDDGEDEIRMYLREY